MNVLIVEDNVRMRKFIRGMVSEYADEIFECSDGKEAAETYNTVRPDWVLMDIKMKENDNEKNKRNP
ncbi:MAG: response regulator [Candidatus Marinimicrobia bacterium]|nr:response regulator [Candidatus Neomarinimicrobiota bacterium]